MKARTAISEGFPTEKSPCTGLIPCSPACTTDPEKRSSTNRYPSDQQVARHSPGCGAGCPMWAAPIRHTGLELTRFARYGGI